MKSLIFVLSLLLLALLVSLAGHSAHHGHHSLANGQPAATHGPPPHVMRTPSVARQHRLVRAVPGSKN